jgi:hypothetical protein
MTTLLASTTARTTTRWAAMAITFGALAMTAGPASADHTSATLACTRGGEQRFNVALTLPARADAGSVYTVRIDGTSSGKISHFGLNYLHDMTVDYVLPPGTSYVEGSAQLVPGTGTANVLPSARLSHRAGVVTLALPGRVAEGTDYTPPSISLQLRAVGAPGSSAPIALRRFRLTANAFLVGEVSVSCEPAVKPAVLGTTLITEPPAT